jgi:hypothetical protein
MSEGLRRALETIVREVSEDLGVPPPRVWVPSPEEWKTTYPIPHYRSRDRTIVVPEGDPDPLDSALHEFVHYLQHYWAGWDEDKAFPKEEYERPYFERGFEKEAYAIADALYNLYRAAFEKELVGEPREVRAKGVACAYIAASAVRSGERAARMAAEKLQESARKSLEGAGALLKLIPLVCPGADGEALKTAADNLREALERLEKGDYRGAETHSAESARWLVSANRKR